ncbi:MAG: DUF2089 domain-containing protein [Bdellovibrionales bacterium]|nr:DUF2089 domain-containing protein [Bdellovibrionales bacterium]
MKLKLKPLLNCPNCQSTMKPVALGCTKCDLEIRGNFPSNPFSSLDEDMQHFLHVFIHCEGKIADMEKALGISYPTVKSKITKLKDATQKSMQESNKDQDQDRELTTLEVLAKMEKGEISYQLGLETIKRIQGKTK